MYNTEESEGREEEETCGLVFSVTVTWEKA